MKRNLIFTLLAGLILVAVYSFAAIKPNHKKHAAKAKQLFTCNAVITSVTGVYTTPTSITLTWTYTGSPSYFTYGGNYFCDTGSHYGTTTTFTNSAVITVPTAYCGINGRIIPLCADGTEGTSKVFSVSH